MTAIVGVVDKGKVYIGVDSGGVSGWELVHVPEELSHPERGREPHEERAVGEHLGVCITRVLSAAEHHNIGVRGPFRVEVAP